MHLRATEMVEMETLLPSAQAFNPRAAVAACRRVWVALAAMAVLEVVPVLVSPVLPVARGPSRPGRRVETVVVAMAVVVVEMCSKEGVHQVLQVAVAVLRAEVARRAVMVPEGKSA